MLTCQGLLTGCLAWQGPKRSQCQGVLCQTRPAVPGEARKKGFGGRMRPRLMAAAIA